MRVTVEDATIEVALAGAGEPIVLIHGFPLTRKIWDAQSAELASHRLVIRPDLRGMGNSSVPGGPYLMETLAGDIAAILDALGIDRASIAGHSLGGYVALSFARMFTERLESLVLVCSRLEADSAQTAREREELADRLDLQRNVDLAVDAYLPRLLAPATLEQRPAIVERARAIARALDPLGAAAMLRGMAQRLDSRDIAGELDVAVLVVAGADDRVVPVAEAERMRDAFRLGTLQVIEGCGHLPMLEAPEALTRALQEFLDQDG